MIILNGLLSGRLTGGRRTSTVIAAPHPPRCSFFVMGDWCSPPPPFPFCMCVTITGFHVYIVPSCRWTPIFRRNMRVPSYGLKKDWWGRSRVWKTARKVVTLLFADPLEIAQWAVRHGTVNFWRLRAWFGFIVTVFPILCFQSSDDESARTGLWSGAGRAAPGAGRLGTEFQTYLPGGQWRSGRHSSLLWKVSVVRTFAVCEPRYLPGKCPLILNFAVKKMD